MGTDILNAMRAILIVAYRRADALLEILDSCVKSGIKEVFIHVDGPKDELVSPDVENVVLVARNFVKNSELNVRLAIQKENLGCAVSLITACDLAFSLVDELIVLEDDCIPDSDFWKFSSQSFEIMETDSSIALFCGPQFAPDEFSSSNWFLSRYPFHWGWGTTSSSWREIRAGLLSSHDLRSTSDISKFECRYWNAGSQRALKGVTDVWDTLFVREMLHLGLTALLPPQNLIRNLGNDEIALHTSEDSAWTNYKIGSYQIQDENPEWSSYFDNWARSEYFKIRRRHLVSTRLTSLLYIFKRGKYQKSLPERLETASVSFL